MPGLIKDIKNNKKQENSMSEENGSKMDIAENEDLLDENDLLKNGIENSENSLNKKIDVEEENEVKLFALKLGIFYCFTCFFRHFKIINKLKIRKFNN